MAGSVRGTHQLGQPLASARDLIREHPLQHTCGPQRTAVMQMHVQRTDVVVLQHLCAQHPRAMCATVRLGALEHDAMRSGVVDRAVHAKALATSEGADSSA